MRKKSRLVFWALVRGVERSDKGQSWIPSSLPSMPYARSCWAESWGLPSLSSPRSAAIAPPPASTWTRSYKETHCHSHHRRRMLRRRSSRSSRGRHGSHRSLMGWTASRLSSLNSFCYVRLIIVAQYKCVLCRQIYIGSIKSITASSMHSWMIDVDSYGYVKTHSSRSLLVSLSFLFSWFLFLAMKLSRVISP